MNDIAPSPDTIDKFRTNMLELRDQLTPENGLMKNVSENVNGKWQLLNQWLDEAREAKRLERESEFPINSNN